MNADGHLDIVGNAANPYSSQTGVWFGAGDGSFGPSQGYAVFSANPVVADMNRDAVPDIVLGGNNGIMYGQRNETNRAPVVDAGSDVTVSYHDVFNDDEENMQFVGLDGHSSDPDLHSLTFEWRDAAGTVLSTNSIMLVPHFLPGSYELTLRVFDGRGGSAEDRMTLTITPIPEIVLHAVPSIPRGTWSHVQDATAASGVPVFNPDKGAPKVVTPLAGPANYVDIWFVADPTQEYKLWIRGKAQNDSWANDSAWVQFDLSLDAGGAPAYRIGTTSALPFNIEECSGCGVSGWGWEDDGWGAVDRNGVTLRFEGGWQRLRIQTREDGLSVDQIVLSAETYKTMRPGKAKSDSTILSLRVR